MKKTFLSLFLCAVAAMAGAQNAHPVTESIFNRYSTGDVTWSVLNDSALDYFIGGPMGTPAFLHSGVYRLDSVDEGTTIYGIAFSAINLSKYPLTTFSDTTVIDTSRANWREYTRLYKPIGDSMVLLGQAPFNIFGQPNFLLPPHTFIRTDPRPYLDNKNYIYGPDSMLITPPMFETYFDTAYHITDSFYFGTTSNCTYTDEDPSVNPFPTRIQSFRHEILLANYQYMNTYNDPGYLPKYEWYKNYNRYMRQWRREVWQDNADYIFFPILTPDPNRTTPTPVDTVLNYFDTTSHVGPVDTTGHSAVYSPQMMERYTQLLPSATQAGQQVAVLSSFHLQAVEVYDAAGRLVQRQPASGIGATIQTADLPAGNYLVRLLTTAGSVTKKLLLQ